MPSPPMGVSYKVGLDRHTAALAMRVQYYFLSFAGAYSEVCSAAVTRAKSGLLSFHSLVMIRRPLCSLQPRLKNFKFAPVCALPGSEQDVR